ncbi:MAG: DUF3343 domain-containing protein [Peptoniphilus sp.]|nr:DUF3343 domain-containing protein [Peptoniphilus sp.]MDY3119098.1 DUF3343 domain-containing protein [Peptoniphilus sp.]
MEDVLIVTFENVTDAIAMEEAVEAEGLHGKLIPLPDNLCAGCGYAWKHDLREEADLERLMKEKQLDFVEILHRKE